MKTLLKILAFDQSKQGQNDASNVHVEIHETIRYTAGIIDRSKYKVFHYKHSDYKSYYDKLLKINVFEFILKLHENYYVSCL